MNHSTALIVIDVQEGYFNGKASFLDKPQALTNIEESFTHIKNLIAKARQLSYTIIYVEHEGYELGSTHADLLPIPDSELLVTKNERSAFKNTNLQDILQEKEIDKLIICGYQTDVCVQSTIESALALNYTVTLIEDAVGAQTEERHQKALSEIPVIVGRSQMAAPIEA